MRYREGRLLDDDSLSPAIVVRIAPSELRLSASIAVPHARELRIGLAAVVEEKSGALSYWALRHAPGKPDFHHPDAFALDARKGAMKFGIDRLLEEPALRAPLAGRRVALLAHPASVTRELDAFARCARGAARTSTLAAAFGPQHGLRGDKQDNMIESPTSPIRCTASRSSASTARCAVRPTR